MAWRQLGDGSWFNANTGELRGLDAAREEQGRQIAISQGRYRPTQKRNIPGPHPPTPTQRIVALPTVQGPMAIIEPQMNPLQVNPYELGMGRLGLGRFGALSDDTKRYITMGVVVAAAAGIVWAQRRFSGFAK